MKNETSRTRIEAHGNTVIGELASTVLGLLLLAPVSLIAAHGALRTVGLVYAALYGLFLIPSAAAYLNLILDAVFIYARKRPLVVPSLMYAHIVGLNAERPAVHSLWRRIARISVHANPLSSLAGRLLHSAMTARSDDMRALAMEATAQARRVQENRAITFFGSALSPQVAIPQPVLRKMEPELVCAGM